MGLAGETDQTLFGPILPHVVPPIGPNRDPDFLAGLCLRNEWWVGPHPLRNLSRPKQIANGLSDMGFAFWPD